MGGDCREAGSGLTPERTVLLELQRKGKGRGGEGRTSGGGRGALTCVDCSGQICKGQ